MRKHKVEVALLVLVPVLAIWLFFVDSGSITTREAELRKRNLLPSFRRDQIERIAFESKDESFELFKRLEDGDSMFYIERKGGEEIADQMAVDRLIAMLEFATPERRLDAPIDREALGLDAPRVRMMVSMGRISYELSLGTEAPSPKGAAYAELSGVGAVVLPRDIVTQLSLNEDAYRSRSLVPYLSPDLSVLRVEGPGGDRHFVRGSWGGWELEGDPRIRADRETLDRMLFAFADIRAEAFLSDEEADRALADDHVTITMVPRDKERPRGVLQIGGACPNEPESVVVVRREPSRISACAPKGVMPALGTPREAFVDKRLFSFRPDEVEELILEEGERKLEIVRKGAGWWMRAPSESEVEAEAGQALARSVHTISAQRIVDSDDLEALGLASPRARATVRRVVESDDEPGATEIVEFGEVRGDYVYARRRTDGTILELGRDVARALEPNSMALKSRVITDIPIAHVRKVSVQAGPFQQTIERSPSQNFQLDTPANFEVDARVAVDIAEALGRLTAERWVAEKDDGSFGLSKPRAVYELEVGAEGEAARTIRVQVGEPTFGGFFAQSSESDGVFVLPRPIARRVETYAIDRGYFQIIPQEIRQLSLRASGKTIKLSRVGERLVAEGDSISLEKAQLIVDKLAELRVEGVVSLGPPRKDQGFQRPTLEIELESQLPGALEAESTRITIGTGDALSGTSIFYARRAHLDASFALAQSQIRSILDAIEVFD